MTRRRTRLGVIAAAAAVATALASAVPAAAGANKHDKLTTATPIEHVVVIFQENVSFDHYFATYPRATNPTGEPAFHAAPHTPTVNGLSSALLNNNPNAANPMRLDRSEPLTCDQNHDYTAEQKAFDGGKMDKFVENTQTASCSPPDPAHSPQCSTSITTTTATTANSSSTPPPALARRNDPAPVSNATVAFGKLNYPKATLGYQAHHRRHVVLVVPEAVAAQVVEHRLPCTCH